MYLALAGAIDQFSLKSVTFFKYSRVVGVHMAIKKKKLALKQAPHHCLLCKKSLRELAVFKRFAILFPPFRVKILLNQSICKVSKIFHCIFINTENGAIFVPVSGWGAGAEIIGGNEVTDHNFPFRLFICKISVIFWACLWMNPFINFIPPSS